MNSIFITYNPKSPSEQTLAVRMHTLGAYHGFFMYLPDRTYNEILSPETKARIQKSNWMVYFSIGALSPQVKAEIEYAYKYFKDKRKIIIIYDRNKGKRITGAITEHFSYFDFDNKKSNVDELTSGLLKQIRLQVDEQEKEMRRTVGAEKAEQDNNSFLALLGIGAGLLLLASFASTKKEKPKKRKS